MASIAMTMTAAPFVLCHRSLKHSSSYNNVTTFQNGNVSVPSTRLVFSNNFLGRGHTCLLSQLPAVGSGLKASITDPKDSALFLKNTQITVESEDDNKLQLRVYLIGKETELAFDKVLRNLARTAPPVPGFRKEKGGKTTKVPKEVLLQMLGTARVTKFVIQEIVSSTIADYAKKENLKVKENKVDTIQTIEELKQSFSPGKDFEFTATLELEKPESEPEPLPET